MWWVPSCSEWTEFFQGKFKKYIKIKLDLLAGLQCYLFSCISQACNSPKIIIIILSKALYTKRYESFVSYNATGCTKIVRLHQHPRQLVNTHYTLIVNSQYSYWKYKPHILGIVWQILKLCERLSAAVCNELRSLTWEKYQNKNQRLVVPFETLDVSF